MVNSIKNGHILLCSAELPDKMREKLSDLFYVIPLPPDECLAEPVRCHPDMLCAVIDEKIIFPSVYAQKYRAVIEEISNYSGYSVVLSNMPRNARYPSDVGLNAAIGRDFVVCRAESTSPELIKCAKSSGRRIINVKQGYAGCSCIIAGDAVLTSDTGIYNALAKEGIEAELCDNSGILLPGYDVGFIGGCGGFFDGTLYFFGDFNSLHCSRSILKFAAQHSLDICKLSKNILADFGGVKFLKKIL